MQAKAEIVRLADTWTYYNAFLRRGIRPDGRTCAERRPLQVARNVVKDTLASCIVSLGGTEVFATVRAVVGTRHVPPAESTTGLREADLFCVHGSGEQRVLPIEVRVDATPLSAPSAADVRAVSVARWVQTLLSSPAASVFGADADRTFFSLAHLDDVFREAQGGSGDEHSSGSETRSEGPDVGVSDDLERFDAAWHLVVDLTCLQLDGNMRDAALFATLSVLDGVCVPSLQRIPGNIIGEDKNKETRVLRVLRAPLSSTFALFGQAKGKKGAVLLCDPTADEEMLSQGVVTAVVDKEGFLFDFSLRSCLPLAKGERKEVIGAAVRFAKGCSLFGDKREKNGR